MALSGGMKIHLRANTYHLRKRVPARYLTVEPRAEVWISLKTDSRLEAGHKAPQVWAAILDSWEAKLGGMSEDAEQRYSAARTLAQARGYRFLPMASVAKLPLDQLVERIEASTNAEGRIDRVLGDAYLGSVKKPEITLSKALEVYWVEAEDKARGKSDDQVRRWQNPRKKALANLIGVIGDLAIGDITAEDLLSFRAWWRRKLAIEDLDPSSANKDFGYIASTIKLVTQAKQITVPVSFNGLNFAANEKVTRLPFARAWIKDKLLAHGALGGLNLEARCILLGMINTGYRPSEAQDLRPEHIRLDVEIPYISIEPVGRTLKTQSSRRIIPLVGVSLEAFKLCPQGFPRYSGTANLSAAVNKFLRENKLLETPEHTFYGLRHSFEDRLLDADIDERIRRDLLGHSLNRERYGLGASIEKLAGIVQRVAL